MSDCCEVFDLAMAVKATGSTCGATLRRWMASLMRAGSDFSSLKSCCHFERLPGALNLMATRSAVLARPMGVFSSLRTDMAYLPALSNFHCEAN